MGIGRVCPPVRRGRSAGAARAPAGLARGDCAAGFAVAPLEQGSRKLTPTISTPEQASMISWASSSEAASWRAASLLDTARDFATAVIAQAALLAQFAILVPGRFLSYPTHAS